MHRSKQQQFQGSPDRHGNTSAQHDHQHTIADEQICLSLRMSCSGWLFDSQCEVCAAGDVVHDACRTRSMCSTRVSITATNDKAHRELLQSCFCPSHTLPVTLIVRSEVGVLKGVCYYFALIST